MKDIVKKAGIDAKLRLRGQGSGFVEHSTGKESEEPLQLCISCPDAYGKRFPKGIDMTFGMSLESPRCFPPKPVMRWFRRSMKMHRNVMCVIDVLNLFFSLVLILWCS